MSRFLAALAIAWGLTFSAASEAQFTIDTSGRSPSNIEGLWWNSSQSGWGATFTQQFHITFVAIYTYDAAGNPTWYVVTNCQVVGNTCSGSMFRVRNGSALTAPWNGGISVTQVGNFTATFTDNSNATMSFTIDGVPGVKQVTRNVFNTSGPVTQAPAETNRQKTERLISGTWTLAYTIISQFTNGYRFNSVTPSTAIAGDWVAIGEDTVAGELVIGSYASQQNAWTILDPGTIIDRFYYFQFGSTINTITGCYYQVNPPGSTNLSDCYSMFGSRSPLKRFEADSTANEGQELAEVQATAKRREPDQPDQVVLDLYLRARAIAASR